MTRLQAFKALAVHPIFKNVYNRLKKDELEECLAFIEKHDHLERAPYNAVVYVWKMDKPKTKNHTTMYSLLLESNIIKKP